MHCFGCGLQLCSEWQPSFLKAFWRLSSAPWTKKGHVLGGPFYYIENGMGQRWRWLAKAFAFFGMCVALFGMGTFTQINSISSAVTGFFDPAMSNTVNILGGEFSIATVIGGLLTAVLAGLVIIGGLKRIATFSEKVVPAMVVIFLVFSFTLIFYNIDKLPAALLLIVQHAFGLQAFGAGMFGAILIAMQFGLARGNFCKRGRLRFCSNRCCCREDQRTCSSGSCNHDAVLSSIL